MKVLGWALMGAFARWWQLGIQMRPFFAQDTIWGYPVFAAVGGGFGYWLAGVEKRQRAFLEKKKEQLLEKRAQAAAAEAAEANLAIGREAVIA